MKNHFICKTSRKTIIRYLGCFVSLCIIFGSFCNISLVASASMDFEKKITPQLQEKMNNSNGQEKLPVAIWYNDIDYNEVKKSVKEETGLTISDLDTDLTMPKAALLEKIQKLSDENDEDLINAIRLDMEEYLSQTSGDRERECSLTNTYIRTERQVARGMYKEHNKMLLMKSHLNDEQIVFISSYAPMIFANLIVSEINDLAKNNQVEQLYYRENVEWVDCSYTTAQQASNTNLVMNMGLTGAGVNVGTIEMTYPDNPLLNFTKIDRDPNQSISAGSHSTNTVEVLSRYSSGNETGVAPGVNLYCTNSSRTNIEYMITQCDVVLINVSSGYVEAEYTFEAKWYDHLVSHHSVTLICSAGNVCNEKVLCPANGYNTIAVGAFDDNNTSDKTDDTLKEGSANHGSSYDSFIAKPDIIASSNLGGGGTSSSAPLVTGSVALMLQLKPCLAASPQTIKAILIAACQRKVSSNVPETMFQGITERQGAGVFDAYSAITIIGRRQYLNREFADSDLFVFEQPAYGASNINTGMAWLRNITATGTNHSGIITGTAYNLRMDIYDRGTLVNYSDQPSSSTEMIYFNTATRPGRYTVLISNNTSSTDVVNYSFAWSVKDAAFRSNDNFEGIYYISNKTADKYLTNNNGSGIINPLSIAGFGQQWVIRKRANPLGSYTIQSNADSNYITSGNSTGISGTYYTIIDTIQKACCLKPQNDGSFIITTISGGQDRALGLLNGNSANGAFLCWSTDTASDEQKWYLEKANFAFGDVNMDGNVNTTDDQLISQYIAETHSFSASELYLADANGDGNVNMVDILYVRKAIAGISGYPI